jgi:hypothetical protein
MLLVWWRSYSGLSINADVLVNLKFWLDSTRCFKAHLSWDNQCRVRAAERLAQWHHFHRPSGQSRSYRGAIHQNSGARVWSEKHAQIPGLDPREVRKQTRGPDERRYLDAGARDCRRLPGPLLAPCGPSMRARCEFSYIFGPGGSMRAPVENLRKTHARSRDWGGAGGLEHQCAGCHATPVEATGSGPREGPSPDTTLHCVGGKRPWCSESALSFRALRPASKGGNVQRSKRAAPMQTLPALRTHPA